MVSTVKEGLEVRVGYVGSGVNRGFNVKVYDGSMVLKTRHFNAKTRGITASYQSACKLQKELAVEYNATLVPPLSVSEYQERAKKYTKGGGKTKRKYTKSKLNNPSESNALVDKFGHTGSFRALIKNALASHGLDKVRDVLKDATELVDEYAIEIMKTREIEQNAHTLMARAILDARSKGVHMDAPNKEVEEAIQRISKASHVKPKTKNVYYILDGERWNPTEQKNMPASFIKYCKQNGGRGALEKLRVG